jgi:type IV pilus assembly protein PilC
MIVTPAQFSHRAELYHQLAQFTVAGIGIVQALQQIERSPPARSFHKPLQRLLAELAEGRTLTESLRHLGSWLPEFDIALIEAGERSGRLDACFRLLSDYYNERARIAKQVIGQLIYPVGLIHFAVFIFLIVLPFASSQFNASLIFLFAKAALVLSPLYIFTFLLIYAAQSRHGEKWRAMIESVFHPIPILGTARRFLALSRLAAALEALISAGVNIVEAWNLAAAASGSPALRKIVEKWKPQIEAGRTPAEVLRDSPKFPEMFSNLYFTGEVSGQLDDSLRRLYRYYNDEGSRKLQAFAQWMPRLIYILIVLIIGYKIIQFYTGYYNNIFKITNF